LINCLRDGFEVISYRAIVSHYMSAETSREFPDPVEPDKKPTNEHESLNVEFPRKIAAGEPASVQHVPIRFGPLSGIHYNKGFITLIMNIHK
jgi:hypothetical protein